MDNDSLIEWCRVPSGVFLYSRLEDRYEGKNMYFHITYDYCLSKYPVTNAQFSEFIADQGYQQSVYWTKIGWNTKLKEQWTLPEYWHDENFNQPKQPLVGISWYEAYAYTQWLSEKVGYPVRLPSEPEWEKAARTSDDYKFPWGNDWDASKCHNSVEGLYINAYPTEVDAFPQGASVDGIMDMAGNVKEICMSEARTDSLEPEDEDARFNSVSLHQRVVRGQSCRGAESYTFSSTFRSAMFPYQRMPTIGFRLMCCTQEND